MTLVAKQAQLQKIRIPAQQHQKAGQTLKPDWCRRSRGKEAAQTQADSPTAASAVGLVPKSAPESVTGAVESPIGKDDVSGVAKKGKVVGDDSLGKSSGLLPVSSLDNAQGSDKTLGKSAIL